jgi:hypothetical protein
MKASSSAPNHSLSRSLAAVVGTIVPALLAGIALTLVLPLQINERYLVGWISVLPMWASLALWVFLARSGRQAWLFVGLVSLSSIVVAMVGVGLGPGEPPQWVGR